MERYSKNFIHEKLAEMRFRPDEDKEAMDENGFIKDQALHCAYYVPLEGSLGMDWGIIVNPNSPKFGLVVFEHSHCGCPDHQPGDPDLQEYPEGADLWLLGKKARRSNLMARLAQKTEQLEM